MAVPEATTGSHRFRSLWCFEPYPLAVVLAFLGTFTYSGGVFRLTARSRRRACSKTDAAHLDHVQPLARTRAKPCVRDTDLQTLCRSCNSRKGANI